MGVMGGVLYNAVGFAGASCKENVQDGEERGTDDLCSCVLRPLESLAVSSTAVPVPDSDAAGQHTLNQGSPSSVLEGLCPAEFSSNPNQTHLKQLIKLLLGMLETFR